MATFEKGDRVVKMSGVNAGKYGTVNSISESGTLNVTFDGERLPRFCDPDRCGKVAANSDFKVGDKVVVSEYLGNTETKRGPAYGTVAKIMTKDVVLVKIDGVHWLAKKSKMKLANAARNAEFKVGDKFAPSDDRGMTLTVGKVEKHPTWGWVYYAKGVPGSWYTADEMVRLNANPTGTRNAKFKVGDKVTFVKSGEKGTVNEVYGDEWYAVWRDGATYPDKVQGYQIKAANACARNADADGHSPEFKVGTKVRWKDEDEMGVGVITQQWMRGYKVEFKKPKSPLRPAWYGLDADDLTRVG